ncbi:hypothetical protein [Roseimicrobium gellanilyticum]|uniref:hypothetical protein n=1 Tax=Roseimicrobium gellanilyticum TaxID=748857 RepID=UPI0011BE6F7A|nr:hypothetical protein [Roseimicrobium gellanilyticum]
MILRDTRDHAVLGTMSESLHSHIGKPPFEPIQESKPPPDGLAGCGEEPVEIVPQVPNELSEFVVAVLFVELSPAMKGCLNGEMNADYLIGDAISSLHAIGCDAVELHGISAFREILGI